MLSILRRFSSRCRFHDKVPSEEFWSTRLKSYEKWNEVSTFPEIPKETIELIKKQKKNTLP